MDDEGDAWLTYAEAGQRLGVSPEAVRAKAIRRGWRRQHGNDGKARVRLPFDAGEPVDRAVNTQSTPVRKSVDPALVHALEGHVASLKTENERLAAALETLKAELAAANARASEESASVEAHNATLKADIEKLEAQLAGAETRASEESAKTAQAIAAFETLAQRLEAMAAQRAIKPWWQRLLRRA